MDKNDPLTDSQETIKREILAERRLIRRRFVGAAIVFGFTFLLWQVGDVLPPQPVIHAVPSPPNERILSSGDRDGAAFFRTDEEDEDESTAAPTTTDDADDNTVSVGLVAPTTTPTLTVAAEQASDDAPTDSGERLQVGVFQDKKNLDNVVEKLRNAGLSPRIEEHSKGSKVYVVNLADDDAVEAAKEQVAILLRELPPTLSASSDDADDLPPPDDVADGDIAVQVGAFSDKTRADKIKQNLSDNKFAVRVEKIQHNDSELFRVRVVGFHSEDEARAAQIQLEKLGYDNPRLVNVP